MLVFCQTDVHDVRTEARVFAMHWCWHSHVPSCPFLLQAWQECREPQTAMFATSQQNCMALGSGFRTKMFGTSKNITRWLVLLQKRNTRVGFFFFPVLQVLLLRCCFWKWHCRDSISSISNAERPHLWTSPGPTFVEQVVWLLLCGKGSEILLPGQVWKLALKLKDTSHLKAFWIFLIFLAWSNWIKFCPIFCNCLVDGTLNFYVALLVNIISKQGMEVAVMPAKARKLLSIWVDPMFHRFQNHF